MDLGEYENAIQEYDKVIQLNPAEIVTYKSRGLAYTLLGKWKRAIQDFDKAILLDPNDGVSYNARGLATP